MKLCKKQVRNEECKRLEEIARILRKNRRKENDETT